jgi:hypothetical protein
MLMLSFDKIHGIRLLGLKIVISNATLLLKHKDKSNEKTPFIHYERSGNANTITNASTKNYRKNKRNCYTTKLIITCVISYGLENKRHNKNYYRNEYPNYQYANILLFLTQRKIKNIFIYLFTTNEARQQQ